MTSTIITCPKQIASLCAKFESSNNAYIAGEVPQYYGSDDEIVRDVVWAQRGQIDGRTATVTWHLTPEESEFEDGFDAPFDTEHVASVLIEDEDSAE